MSTSTNATRGGNGRQIATNLVAEWNAARALLRAYEELEHPNLTDHHGRVWVWVSGDLYKHDDTLCWPRVFIEDTALGLPSEYAIRNPNYSKLCDICLGRQGLLW